MRWNMLALSTYDHLGGIENRGGLAVQVRRGGVRELVRRQDVPSGPTRSNVCVTSSTKFVS